MPSDKQKARIEELKKETTENVEKTYNVLKALSELNDDNFISTTEIACAIFPSCTFELPIANGGKVYKQNSQASSVMDWLKRLVNEGRVETQKKFGSRVYRPLIGQVDTSITKQ
jgi:hypothetical protein